MNFLNEICGRPANEKPIMLIVVGHAEEGATIPVQATIKKPFEQIASWI
jgi:hypothetical protein